MYEIQLLLYSIGSKGSHHFLVDLVNLFLLPVPSRITVAFFIPKSYIRVNFIISKPECGDYVIKFKAFF